MSNVQEEFDEYFDEDEAAAHGAFGDTDDYGFCPVCGAPGEAVGSGMRQWVVCHADKVKWRLGLGFFALFHRKEKWDATPLDVKTYREVKPLKEPVPGDDEARFRRMMGE